VSATSSSDKVIVGASSMSKATCERRFAHKFAPEITGTGYDDGALSCFRLREIDNDDKEQQEAHAVNL